jgi:hypothetical protein
VSEISEHLRGPWKAVLSDEQGRVYDDPADAPRGTFLETSIRRGSALPESDGVLPGVLDSVDLIDVAAEWEQVKAMVDGLNAARRANEPGA